MSTAGVSGTPLRKAIRHELEAIRGKWIWRELPASGLVIIGVLVGISLIFRGVSWLKVGLTLKRIPQTGA